MPLVSNPRPQIVLNLASSTKTNVILLIVITQYNISIIGLVWFYRLFFSEIEDQAGLVRFSQNWTGLDRTVVHVIPKKNPIFRFSFVGPFSFYTPLIITKFLYT